MFQAAESRESKLLCHRRFFAQRLCSNPGSFAAAGLHRCTTSTSASKAVSVPRSLSVQCNHFARCLRWTNICIGSVSILFKENTFVYEALRTPSESLCGQGQT